MVKHHTIILLAFGFYSLLQFLHSEFRVRYFSYLNLQKLPIILLLLYSHLPTENESKFIVSTYHELSRHGKLFGQRDEELHSHFVARLQLQRLYDPE